MNNITHLHADMWQKVKKKKVCCEKQWCVLEALIWAEAEWHCIAMVMCLTWTQRGDIWSCYATPVDSWRLGHSGLFSKGETSQISFVSPINSFSVLLLLLFFLLFFPQCMWWRTGEERTTQTPAWPAAGQLCVAAVFGTCWHNVFPECTLPLPMSTLSLCLDPRHALSTHLQHETVRPFPHILH